MRFLAISVASANSLSNESKSEYLILHSDPKLRIPFGNYLGKPRHCNLLILKYIDKNVQKIMKISCITL